MFSVGYEGCIFMNDIFFEVKNNLGIIILNRPQSLNALSRDMFLLLQERLTNWKKDNAIKAVLIRANGEKAFCAGGDIKAIYENRQKSADEIARYFRIEYDINRMIADFGKPYIALLHGITMGGGVGVSIHGSHCVASENLRWAMPETLIGFFPDVGASYYLSRLPNHIGTYLALTGNSVDAAQALQLHFIHAIVPFNQFDLLEKKLSETAFEENDFDIVTKIIRGFAIRRESQAFSHAQAIQTCFAFETIEAIFAALSQQKTDWSLHVLSELQKRSPTSLKVTLQQLKRARQKTVHEVLEMDFHIAHRMLTQHDFFEGVRAAVIDKDKNPKWEPATLEVIPEHVIQSYF